MMKVALAHCCVSPKSALTKFIEPGHKKSFIIGTK